MPTISKQQPMRPAEIELVDQVNANTGDIATQTARLTQEITDRTNADNALGNRITAETNRATAAENTLTQNLATEVSDRKAADTTLQGNIDTEVSRAKAAEEANANAITAETNRATAAENKLTNRDTELTALINKVAGVEDASVATFEDNVKGNTDAITALQGKFPVTTNDIGDLQVNNAKLATNAVTTDRITDKNVTKAKLEESVQSQLTFLETVPAMEFGTSNAITVAANSNTTVDITFGSAKTEAPVVFCGLQHESGNLACIVTSVSNLQCAIKVYNLTSTDVSEVTVDYLAISGR